jgi:hypothetical protein
MNQTFEFVGTKFVLYIHKVNLICMLIRFFCTNWYCCNCMFKYMFTGDWLYMLFMHQTCVYETKQQYVKSKETLTAVFKEAHLNCRINDILKDAIQAFQVKMNVKQEYLAYYVRKNIHNCYDAMTTSPVESIICQTTSPVESINCHIMHRSKASTLNNTSRSLMLIMEGTNSRIAGIDNSVKHKLQLTVLSSKLTVRNLYHRKCVYLLNRLFDGQKSRCCVMHVPAEWMVWIF